MSDSDADTVRLWMVDRTYTDKGMLRLEYATPDGERHLTKQRSLNAGDPTAAIDVEPDRLEPVTDEDTRERYASEATRMRDQHDPDKRV